jgi:predicted hotdog family 3-hydroxylacyl-ACP dehydratase
MTGAPRELDHAGIAARIPHAGRMGLLDRMREWSADSIRCTALNPSAADHPLRTSSGLLAPAAIEYAAQAMALHGTLIAQAQAGAAAAPTPGFLASVRSVRLAVQQLDDVPGELDVYAQRQAGNESQIIYAFEVRDGSGRLLVEGRATVVLNASPIGHPQHEARAT